MDPVWRSGFGSDLPGRKGVAGMDHTKSSAKQLAGTVLCSFAVLMLITALYLFSVAFSNWRDLAQHRQLRVSEEAAIRGQLKGMRADIQRLERSAHIPSMKRPLKIGESHTVAELSGERRVSVVLHRSEQRRMATGEVGNLFCVFRSDVDGSKRSILFREGVVSTLGGNPCLDKHVTFTFYEDAENVPVVDFLLCAAGLIVDGLEGVIEDLGEEGPKIEHWFKSEIKVYGWGGLALLAVTLPMGWMGVRLRRKRGA